MLATAADAATGHVALQDQQACPLSLLSKVSSSIHPLTDSMNFLANALSSKPTSLRSLAGDTRNPDAHTPGTPSLQASSEHLDTDFETSKSEVRTKLKRQSTAPRTKTVFQLRYPPPTTKQKQRLHIRPKLLLQLHRTSQISRPKPTFDVLPSGVFAHKLARKFPSTFKGKNGLGVDDLVVVSSEDYTDRSDEDDHSDDILGDNEKWKSRDIVAAIRQLNQGESKYEKKAEICFSRSTWTASTHPKGGYEFAYVDENGVEQVARWVSRRRALRKQPSDSSSVSTQPPEKPAFNFSLIDPSSRRHAIIATMDAQSIDVYDSYCKPANDASSISEDANTTPTPIEVDEALRKLITVTGIWVAWCEGFLHDQIHNLSATIAATSPVLESLTAPSEPAGKCDHKRRSLSLQISTKERNSIISQASPGSGRPGLRQSDSTPAVPVSPSVHSSLLTPRRAQSLSSNAYIRRSNSRRETIFEDAATVESDTTTEDRRASTIEETPASSLGEEETKVDMIPQRNASRLITKEKEKKRKSKVFGKLFSSQKD